MALDLIGTGFTRHFGIADEPGGAVPGHIKLGNHANPAIPGIGDQIVHLVLRVIKTVGTHFLQLGKLLAFHPEALVIGQVPVKDVHLHGSHAVKVAPDHIRRDEVAADINHQASPDETRGVMNRDCRHRKAPGRCLDELQKSLQAMKRPQGVECRKFCA